jgi:chromosome segregation ATPase
LRPHGRDRLEGRHASSGPGCSASLATDLEITRAELRRVRDDRDRLKAKVQRGLGHQVSQAGTAELAARIKDLTARLERQDAELTQARAQITGLTSEREAALDDIAGLRIALRQMTREQNTLN